MLLKVFAHRIQDFDEQRVAQRVQNLIPVLAREHQMVVPQNRQVLGKICWLHLNLIKDCSNRKLFRPQGFNDVDTGGMSQDLEDSRLELSEGVKMFWIKRFF